MAAGGSGLGGALRRGSAVGAYDGADSGSLSVGVFHTCAVRTDGTAV